MQCFRYRGNFLGEIAVKLVFKRFLFFSFYCWMHGCSCCKTFQSVDEILVCHHQIEDRVVLSCGTVYYTVQIVSLTFNSLDRILRLDYPKQWKLPTSTFVWGGLNYALRRNLYVCRDGSESDLKRFSRENHRAAVCSWGTCYAVQGGSYVGAKMKDVVVHVILYDEILTVNLWILRCDRSSESHWTVPVLILFSCRCCLLCCTRLL